MQANDAGDILLVGVTPPSTLGLNVKVRYACLIS